MIKDNASHTLIIIDNNNHREWKKGHYRWRANYCMKYSDTCFPQEFQKPADILMTAIQFFLNNVEQLNQVVPRIRVVDTNAD